MVVSSGNRYRINALFEVIGLCAVDAQGYPTIQAMIQDIAAHRQREELETHDVPVLNLRLHDGAPGRIFYNVATDRWRIENDPSRSISIEHLTIVKA